MKSLSHSTIFFAVLLILTSAVQAKPCWKAELPGGTYEVALDSITSVSTHSYLVDGVMQVNELTIDTTGSVVARFYFISPADVQTPSGIGQSIKGQIEQHISDLVDKSGQGNIHNVVIKNYPATTHAKTVEYRLTSDGEVQALFKSAEAAWRNYKETTYKPDTSKQ
jgi:hypothetical protein